MSGYFTKTEDVQVDIDMNDIIENLDSFSKKEVQELLEQIEDILDVSCEEVSDNPFSIAPDNLYDEQKMEYIKKIYSKMSLEQLRELANKLS